MKAAILGTRGIPNEYGGFEQLAEKLSVALTLRGHEISVYNSSLHAYKNATYKSVDIIRCYDPEDKMGTAGQFIYDLNCMLDARKRNFDAILLLGYTSSSVWQWLLPAGVKIICNMDGLEWKRSKYSKWVQRFLKYAEKLAATNSNELISDSPGIQKYLADTYRIQSTYIPYGANIYADPILNEVADALVLKKYGLTPRGYFLLIARFEPENNIEEIIRGYLGSNRKEPLVLVGSTRNKYGSRLQQTYPSEKIIFTGPVYDTAVLDPLRYFSRLYFHGHSVGGTNPSLLEAMGAQALICAHRNTFNENVLGNDALYFANKNDIALMLNRDDYEAERLAFTNANLAKIRSQYNWPMITDAYEKVITTK